MSWADAVVQAVTHWLIDNRRGVEVTVMDIHAGTETTTRVKDEAALARVIKDTILKDATKSNWALPAASNLMRRDFFVSILITAISVHRCKEIQIFSRIS